MLGYLTTDSIILFQEVNNFLQAKLEKKRKLCGTDHVWGLISEYILNVKAIVFIIEHHLNTPKL